MRQRSGGVAPDRSAEVEHAHQMDREAQGPCLAYDFFDQAALADSGLAAQQNFDTAQLDLGAWLIEGRGGERDEKRGFRILKQVAEACNVAAQARIAKLHLNGIGTEPDTIFAAAWYILARRAGLTDPQLEDFMNGLTDEEIRTALQRANRLR